MTKEEIVSKLREISESALSEETKLHVNQFADMVEIGKIKDDSPYIQMILTVFNVFEHK